MVCVKSMFYYLILYILRAQGFVLFDNHGNGVDDVVNTSCGRVRGHWNVTAGGYSFLGIPYASPPVGKLRWMPPVPLDSANGNCWSGEFDALSAGNKCTQPLRTYNLSKVDGNEDCLYLNVWTPSTRSDASLPVMVWIHGGNLVFGDGNGEGYRPSAKLARDTNIVYVSMNYRLNAFGFMALEMLAAVSPTNTSGNYGLMDQIAVLKWVKENIRHFGGDPNKVTIFGQSSGGTAVFALMGSPLTKGLFQKAWMSSASPILNKTASQAFKDNDLFLKNTKCPDIDCLYNLSAVDIISSVPWTEYPSWSMNDLVNLPTKGQFNGALAIVDGYVLPLEAPLEAWVHGTGQDVPILIGSTSHETDFGAYEDDAVWQNWTLNQVYEQNVRGYLTTFDDVIAETALKLYPRAVETPASQIASMSSDVRVTCPTDYISLIASTAFSSSVYRYIAAYKPSQPSKRGAHYAFHGIDIDAFFDTWEFSFNNTSVRDAVYIQTLRNEVVSFVKSGHPATVAWKPYPLTTSLVTDSIDVTSGYHTHECQFWLRNGFFSYAWIN